MFVKDDLHGAFAGAGGGSGGGGSSLWQQRFAAELVGAVLSSWARLLHSHLGWWGLTI